VIRAHRRGPHIVPAAAHDARTEAAAILTHARDEAERIRAHARDEGRTEGRAEVAATLVRLAEARDRALTSLETQVTEIAFLAATRLVGDALAREPTRIGDVVGPLLARVRRARQVTLRVHPDDRTALASALPTLARESELAGAVTIEADPAVARGGCIVTSDAGVLDARVEVRLDALRAALGADPTLPPSGSDRTR
jgi:type III secretion system HrpE/YscL family protein